MPLSDAARAALDSVCTDDGLIFGDHDCVMLPRRAAEAAGIDAYRAARIYDFRHSAATHLGRSSDNLPGVMYLLGHKQPATTGRYMRPQKDAASDVLRAAATAAQFRSHSGHAEPSKPSDAPPTPQRQNPEPSEMIRGLPSVRGRGLEPRWLLTASTSNAIDSLYGSVSAELERQETSEIVEKRLVSAQQNQNAVGGVGAGRAEVMRTLYSALEAWKGGGTTRELRLHLVRLLALIETLE